MSHQGLAAFLFVPFLMLQKKFLVSPAFLKQLPSCVQQRLHLNFCRAGDGRCEINLETGKIAFINDKDALKTILCVLFIHAEQ